MIAATCADARSRSSFTTTWSNQSRCSSSHRRGLEAETDPLLGLAPPPPRRRRSSSSMDGGSTYMRPRRRTSRIWDAPRTSISRTTSRPASEPVVDDPRGVPDRWPTTSAHSRSSPARIIRSKASSTMKNSRPRRPRRAEERGWSPRPTARAPRDHERPALGRCSPCLPPRDPRGRELPRADGGLLLEAVEELRALLRTQSANAAAGGDVELFHQLLRPNLPDTGSDSSTAETFIFPTVSSAIASARLPASASRTSALP